MGSENEPAKLLLPYLQRADELQKHEHLVAYYCRLYAMERGLKIPAKERTKMTNELLVSLMNQLEKDKKSLKLGPEDNLYVEGFAINVFSKADKQDRAGRADLNTAKTFYAASIFFEILNQFGELQPELEQKQKYAVWKAADIRKALKEGRRPESGPPGGDKDLSIPSTTTTSPYDLGQNESFQPSQPGIDASSRLVGRLNQQPSARGLTSASSFSAGDHPSNDFPQPLPPPTSRVEDSAYPQPYHHQPYSHDQQQPYSHEQQQSFPQNYPPPETSSSLSYSNFQSYPSFSESSVPTAPGHHPSYYQGYDPAYTHQSTLPASNYPSTLSQQPQQSGVSGSNYSPLPQYNSGVNGACSEPTPSPTTGFKYDSNYQPPPDKIAEAHKAARFAVGALAFDDVPVAVDFLIRSLELLTNPLASQ
ncbi:hypothetical protein MRB53_010397 [Persea americana]|uniref:Uncharacterized protein n=1 Tax=Persea americana TaxID=3435 RepID=A0ACC2LRY6_PERAE|nr:hypothetical protein MRB53_010397 [Persea americana]|eukprot:TRINITY_DN2286_c1_g5_i1.p1 TRINITY_DN2286_c1_g5~~TRINITY_DN2286_c1_g5_i1.p1  ORF type:complete len:420 (-),score=87.35 TRINITY_DN2286_c1_g5_i1:196-1455(-)